MNIKNNLVSFVTKNAQSLKWAIALIIVNASTYSFVLKNGTVQFDNQFIQILSYCLSGLLYSFIVFRQLKPRGAQDIQALLILLFMPSFLFIDSTVKQALIILVFTVRWHRLTRIAGATVSTLAAMAMIYFGFPCFQYYYIQSDSNKVLYSRTDGIYCLYGYPWQNVPNTTYLLFRKVQLLPGISLAKKICDYTSDKKVIVTRTTEGEYKIVDIPTTTSK
ncbi:hypothetical protein KA344_09260 [bacterium]|jgi:hypothetical protein|nr:hypothetical protein [bacterium]